MTWTASADIESAARIQVSCRKMTALSVDGFSDFYAKTDGLDLHQISIGNGAL